VGSFLFRFRWERRRGHNGRLDYTIDAKSQRTGIQVLSEAFGGDPECFGRRDGFGLAGEHGGIRWLGAVARGDLSGDRQAVSVWV
jgi:hypothetical protein